jgi:type IV pilus assembly protein PilP
LLSILLFIFFDPVLASQEVIYKDTRPLKKLFDTEKSTGDSKVDKGYLYDPIGKTDPFKSFIAIREETDKKKRRKPKTYLETLSLSQLDLTSIVISSKGRWAMVRDSKGLGHVIKEGTAIGTNGGVVHKIARGEVIIREAYKDFRGNIQYRDISKKTPSLQ